MQFIPGGARADLDETYERLESLAGRAANGLGVWALEERESGRLVGIVGLFPLAWQGPELELAYHVVPSAWNRGFATEAARAVLAAAWDGRVDHVVAVPMTGQRATT